MACDLILAGEKAKFGQPETGLGITPGFSGTQRLLRRVGVSKAKELIYTGRMIDAQEALQIGLADRIYPDDQLQAEALAMAKKIAANAPVAVRYAKCAINEGASGKNFFNSSERRRKKSRSILKTGRSFSRYRQRRTEYKISMYADRIYDRCVS